MFKYSIRLPSIYFVVSTVWQLVANKGINWIDNIMVCFLMFLMMLFINWSKTPYKWKKDDTP